MTDAALDPARENQIRALIAEARVLEAAALAEEGGAPQRASQLFEQACRFDRAARASMRAGNVSRALVMFAIDGSSPHFMKTLANAAVEDVARIADDLAARRLDSFAALAFSHVGRHADAARAWERSGATREAAEAYERAGEARNAARVLERRIAEAPESSRSLYALGELLLKHGRHENALSALQKIPSIAPEAALAKPLLHACFDALGLHAAAHDLAESSPALVPVATPSAPRTSDDPAATGALMFGRFRFESDVARSGSARVVRAYDELARSSVAIKWLHTASAVGQGRDAWSRFVREVRIQSEMRHPHIVPVLDFFPDAPAIITPWMAGGSLATRIKEPMAPSRAVEIAIAVLSALGEAHRLGVLHRDVKPANVLFDAAGTPHLCDFGVAHLGDGDNTITAAAVGSLAYMSPEQRQGRSASIKSDVFGVGIMLWELMTSKLPEPDDAPGALARVHEKLTLVHERVVRSLFAEDEAERPEDAFAAARALRALPWPTDWRVYERTGPASIAPASTNAATRLQNTPKGVVDAWLGRAVQLVPLTDENRDTLLAFAGLATPYAERVLKLDETGASVWVAPPARDPERALGQRHWAPLHGALEALHARGALHGAIDVAHVVITSDDTPVLLVPRRAASGPSSPSVDRAALERLFSH